MKEYEQEDLAEFEEDFSYQDKKGDWEEKDLFDSEFEEEDCLEEESFEREEDEEHLKEEDFHSDDDFIHSLCNNTVSGYYKDEEEIETGFSFEDWDIDDIEHTLRDYFKFFSKEERDFIYLNFLLGKSQVELAEFFGKTQPALCNDSNRIKKEIKIIMKLQKQSKKVLEFLLQDGTGLSYFTREILLVFYQSMSVTKVARIMGLNSMLCRARIESAIQSLKDLGWEEIHSYFQYILENLNKIKRSVSEEVTSTQKTSKCDYTDGHLLQEFDFDD